MAIDLKFIGDCLSLLSYGISKIIEKSVADFVYKQSIAFQC